MPTKKNRTPRRALGKQAKRTAADLSAALSALANEWFQLWKRTGNQHDEQVVRVLWGVTTSAPGDPWLAESAQRIPFGSDRPDCADLLCEMVAKTLLGANMPIAAYERDGEWVPGFAASFVGQVRLYPELRKCVNLELLERTGDDGAVARVITALQALRDRGKPDPEAYVIHGMRALGMPDIKAYGLFKFRERREGGRD